MNTKLVIKIKYASIERLFNNKMDAMRYLFEVRGCFDVLSYEIKEL